MGDQVVILGGTGFIGSRIRSVLDRHAECVSVSSSEVDLRDTAAAKAALAPLVRDATVVHAAGIPRLASDAADTLLDNIRITTNVIAACEEVPPARLVFLSSVEVYGTPKALPITEQTPFRPNTNYAVGKIAGEQLLARWHRRSGCPLAVLRLPGVYGPGDRGRGFVGALMAAQRDKSAFTLIGDGTEERDFLFVEDVGRVVAALMGAPVDHWTLNVATGKARPIADLLAHVTRSTGGPRVQRKPRTGELCHLRFDTSELRRRLPEVTFTPVEDGIRRYGQASTRHG